MKAVVVHYNGYRRVFVHKQNDGSRSSGGSCSGSKEGSEFIPSNSDSVVVVYSIIVHVYICIIVHNSNSNSSSRPSANISDHVVLAATSSRSSYEYGGIGSTPIIHYIHYNAAV